MPLGSNPAFSQVKAFFGGSDNLSHYYRGGPYVPNIPANYAISTTAAGLALTQFSGADKVTLPPAPYLTDNSAGDSVQSGGGYMQAWAECTLNNNGYAYSNSGSYGSGASFQWLPAGRSASEYQYRTSYDGVNWSAWASLAGNVSIVYVSATTDGFYSDYAETYVYVQLGAQGTALTGVATFSASASASGRG